MPISEQARALNKNYNVLYYDKTYQLNVKSVSDIRSLNQPIGHQMPINSGIPRQETLTEGKGSVQLTSLFRSAASDITNNNYFLAKQASFMRRSTVLSLPFRLEFSDLAFSSVSVIRPNVTAPSLLKVFFCRNETENTADNQRPVL